MTIFRSILFLPPLIWIPNTLAQDCRGATCNSCLEGFNCVWNVADNACQEACGDFPNVNCFYDRTFGGDVSTNQVCDAAANKVQENEVCFSKTTAESCLQQAGCDWTIGRIANGEERTWCALDLDYTPAAIPCSSDNCDECLSDNNCVWQKDGTCANSCDNFPNIECYYGNMFGVVTEAYSAKICEVANNPNRTAAHETCYDEITQDECFSVEGCAWIPTDESDPKNNGFCTIFLDYESESEMSGAVQRCTSFILAAAACLIARWW